MFSIAAADASGFVYLLDAGNAVDQVSTLAKVDGASGKIAWTRSILQQDAFLAYLGRNAALQVVRGDEGPISLESVDPNDDLTSTSPIGASGELSGLVIGSDASLYVTYVETNAAGDRSPVISRIRPDGTFAWTSRDFAGAHSTTAPVSGLALGPNDAVIFQDGTNLFMLDPATGELAWTAPAVGYYDVVVAADGSIAQVATRPTVLQVLEPTGALRHKTTIETDGLFVGGIAAVATDGTVLIEGEALWAVDASGKLRWKHHDGGSTAFIDAAGTVIVTQKESIAGLDLQTGATLWTLSAPSSVSCIQSTTVTSSGGIVAIGCGGMMFGASD